MLEWNTLAYFQYYNRVYILSFYGIYLIEIIVNKCIILFTWNTYFILLTYNYLKFSSFNGSSHNYLVTLYFIWNGSIFEKILITVFDGII